MAAKSFKGVKGAGAYDMMWSKSNPAKTEGEQWPTASIMEFEQGQESRKAIESSIEEALIKRGRGRPKMAKSVEKKHVNLLLDPETLKALIKAKARIELEEGVRLTVTGVIIQAIEDFITAHGGAVVRA